MPSLASMKSILLIGVATAMVAAPAFAASTLPRSEHQGGIAYISGGIGLSGQRAMDATAREYNLRISNANRTGDFTAGTNVVIRRRSGRAVLDVADTGPLLYAKLPPGDYIIRAVNEGVERRRDVRISANRSTVVHLIWPQKG
jgi:hypothetical protein